MIKLDVNDLVHLTSYSDHSGVTLLCDGSNHAHLWGADGIIRRDMGLGGGIYKADDGIIFTHTDQVTTCEACIDKKIQENRKELDERIKRLKALSEKTNG